MQDNTKTASHWSGKNWGVKQKKLSNGESRWYTDERMTENEAISMASHFNKHVSFDPLTGEKCLYRPELILPRERY